MASCFLTLVLLTFVVSTATAARNSIIQLPSVVSHRPGGGNYCEAWKFSVETNSAGTWETVPKECEKFVAEYVNGKQYGEDYQIVVNHAIDFARTIDIGNDSKDAWIFDIDETLLSNLPYYRVHGYGTEPFDEMEFNEWVEKGKAKAFDASIELYNEVKKLGFSIILLTGRDEKQRNITVENILRAGYSNWKKLILRSSAESGQSATSYKSGQRAELVKKGYRIHGSTGDQWSDLNGYPEANRSFKAPNPMYYIP